MTGGGMWNFNVLVVIKSSNAIQFLLFAAEILI